MTNLILVNNILISHRFINSQFNLFPFFTFSIRFSLLLLEPGEIYFEDFSVFHYPNQFSEEEAIKRYTCMYLMG